MNNNHVCGETFINLKLYYILGYYMSIINDNFYHAIIMFLYLVANHAGHIAR